MLIKYFGQTEYPWLRGLSTKIVNFWVLVHTKFQKFCPEIAIYGNRDLPVSKSKLAGFVCACRMVITSASYLAWQGFCIQNYTCHCILYTMQTTNHMPWPLTKFNTNAILKVRLIKLTLAYCSSPNISHIFIVISTLLSASLKLLQRTFGKNFYAWYCTVLPWRINCYKREQ